MIIKLITIFKEY